MNSHNKSYASFLPSLAFSTLAFLSCAGGRPELRNPEGRYLFEGVYVGELDGRSARYTVEKEGCVLITGQKVSLSYGWEMRTVMIKDTDCDNTADSATDQYGVVRGRKYFERNGTVEHLDSLLEQGQGLVQKENRIKE